MQYRRSAWGREEDGAQQIWTNGVVVFGDWVMKLDDAAQFCFGQMPAVLIIFVWD